jgi:CRP-like cAMP-binding protein
VFRPTVATLAELPLFRRVSPEHLTRLSTLSSLRTYERGEGVFNEGDPSEVFIVVLSGRIKVFKHTPAGGEIILEIFGPGEPLGAVAVYELRPYPASAVAIEPATCLRVPRPDFLTLLEQHPDLVRGLLSSLSHRLVELTARLSEVSGARVETRFARVFLKLARQLGRTDRGGTFIPLPLSRQELADLTGTTIETCIRIMSRWDKDEIVQTTKDGFVLVNAAALEDIAHR